MAKCSHGASSSQTGDIVAKKRVQIVRIEGRIFWLARQDKLTGQWLGVCPPLNLNASGDTYQELQAVANEAMKLLFEDLMEEGDLGRFLQKNSWKMVGNAQPGVETRFDIPANWKQEARLEKLLAATA